MGKINQKKYFNNIKKIINEYKLNRIKIHNYIWIPTTEQQPVKSKKKNIKIRKTNKKIKKITFIL